MELDGESGTLFIDLDLIEVEGEVSLGKEPLSAKLRFSSGRLGETIAFDSDRYGRFTGMLPGEGAYRVRVNAVAPAVARDLTGVQVESSGPGEGRVRIRLPATRVRGAVVDEQGKPIEGAWVQAESIAEPEVPTSSPATAKDGSFEFEGLPPGPLRLMAEAPDGRTSPWALTILQETRLPPEIRLVVRDVVSVRGRIVADELGIPGAAVYVSPANQPVGVGQRVVTDVAGRFQAQLPKRAGGALITVSAPGFARRALRFRELPQEPLSIQVERYGGQLVLQVDAPPGPEDWAQPQVVVFKDGVPSPLPALASWAQMNGLRQETDDLLVVPLLEAGTYTACRMWLAEIERTDEAALPGPRCASGFLPPLGELRLRVPLMREGSTSPPADTRFR